MIKGILSKVNDKRIGMRSFINSLCLVLVLFFCVAPKHSFSQINTDTTVTGTPGFKQIEIIQARSLRQITLSGDIVLETLAGNAKVRQGNTILEGDSIVIDKSTGFVEVFGNVHINDADTVHTYAQYLRYVGAQQIAYLQNKVKLTDGKATLTTEDLTYDLKSGIASYQNGGKVVNGKTVLNSRHATYYSDTKDVFFDDQVKLKDPKYDMEADSLRYNTAFKTVYFISPTKIKTEEGKINTWSGIYKLETGEAIFYDKTVFRDSTRYISGNKVAFDEKSNTIQIEEYGKFVDSVNQVMILGDQILIDKKNNSFLATRKPVMILYRDKDSTFITADTLFSGIRAKDSIEMRLNEDDSSNTSLKEKKSDSVRYFVGYNNVRIYNDSIQAISDSMYISSLDSTFKLMKQPVCWNGNSQLSGDTISLKTKSRQPEKLWVKNNAIMINKSNDGIFNQVSGTQMTGDFEKGQLTQLRTKGQPAESIYYAQDDDSAYVGMNRNSSDVIDAIFTNKELRKIKFINEVKGVMYPMNQIPPDKKTLSQFLWLMEKRPKSKMEIFE
jgi:lipopolysaccharide export system protein LptA